MRLNLIGEYDEPLDLKKRKLEPDFENVSIKEGDDPSNFVPHLTKSELKDLLTPEVRVIARYFGFDLMKTTFEDDDYYNLRKELEHLKPVNDVAERSIKLTKDYNEFGPRNEEQHQNLLKTESLSVQKISSRTKTGLGNETAKLKQ